MQGCWLVTGSVHVDSNGVLVVMVVAVVVLAV